MDREEKVLPASFYNRPTIAVARDLVGQILIKQEKGQIIKSMITEVEAYDGPNDLASHAAGGRRTKRNEVMYGAGGFWYVYLVYGLHHLLNVSVGPKDYPAAVLIRSVEAVSGPGRLTKYFNLNLNYNGQSASEWTGLSIIAGEKIATQDIIASPRIGIDYAGEVWRQKPFRFYWRNMIK